MLKRYSKKVSLMISIRMTDKSKTVLAKLGKFPEEARRRVFDQLYIYANEMRNTMIESMKHTTTDMSKPQKRTKGKVTKKTKYHYPSLPGFPPAIDTGALAGSIRVEKREHQGQVEVGSKGNAPYSEALEKGTGKMEARPFILPAFEAHEQDMRNAVMRAIKESAEEVGK
jgi:HK97 gp10 family phage protein